MQNQRSMSLNFLILRTSGGILSWSAAFLLLILVCTASIFSSVNCANLMSSWLLIIFPVGLFVISFVFPCKFVKKSFHFWSLSFWLAVFSLSLLVLFISLTLFTVMLFGIVYLQPYFWIYWFSLERIVDVLFVLYWAFLSCCELAFVGFLLLN